MQQTKRIARVMIVTAVLLSLVVGCKQSGGEDKTKAPSGRQKKSDTKKPETKTKKPSEPPTLVSVEGYQQWLKMNREPIDGRAHGRTNIYINQEQAKIAPDGEPAFPFPDGTVIVKEVLTSDLVAIMRKTEGSDPDHNDWQWIEYGAGGSVVGKDAECWSCHNGAESTDYVFTGLDIP